MGPFSSEVNMTNCYYLCGHFFKRFASIHFNQLIAYWMMAGYLGPASSVEAAYQRGLGVLYSLIYEEGVLKVSERDENEIEFVKSAPNSCQHGGICINEKVWFTTEQLLVFLDFNKIGKVMLADGVGKKRDVAIDQLYSRSVEYLAHFNPTVDSSKPLLENVTELSLLLLRGCDSLPPTSFPLEVVRSLTVLEISGTSYLTTIPENTISQLIHLEYLNLSDLLVENLPDDFLDECNRLIWLIVRRCSKLGSLPAVVSSRLELLDLSHCTALQELVFIGSNALRVIDLSYTALTDTPGVHYDRVTHLFLRDSKLRGIKSLVKGLGKLWVLDLSGAREVKHVSLRILAYNFSVLDLSRTQVECLELYAEECTKCRIMILQDCKRLQKLPSMKIMSNLEILDISGCEKVLELPTDTSSLRNLMELNLSGCSGLGFLSEGVFDHMSRLWKLDLSRTKVEHLPSLANLTRLSALSLRDLNLDSLETLKSLSNLVQLDLRGLKTTSAQELQLDFLEFLEKLEILDLSQTFVAKLPGMYKLASLRELLLADCQHLVMVPDLQTLPNLEVLDLSLADGSAVNCQGEIEFGASFSTPPSSLQKLVLTNRSGVHKVFPLTSVGNLEFLDLRGTDVTCIPHHYVKQIKCIHLPAVIDFSQVELSGMGSCQQVSNLDGNSQGGDVLQRRVSKPFEIHVVSKLKKSFPNSNEASSSGQPSSFDTFGRKFTVLEDLISEMQEMFKSPSDGNGSFKLQSLRSDLKYIQENIDRMRSSHNCKISEELLQELMAAATHLSATDFLHDPTNFKQFLRIVVKLKLLIPRTEEEYPKVSEITSKKKKKKKPWYERSKKKKEKGADIAEELSYQDLLSTYEALTVVEKQCLLCFSVFAYKYNEDSDDHTENANLIVVKKRMLIYWWVGEGFIGGTNNATTIEEMGESILKVLTHKGFVEPVMENGPEPTSCGIRPSVHSFVTARAKEVDFFDFNQENGKLATYFTRSQRACFLNFQDYSKTSCKLWEDYTHSPKSLESFTNIRTLFNVNESLVHIKPEWFSRMKSLSVLHLRNWRSDNSEPIEVVDQSFLKELKNMKQLRLLSLQGLPTIKKLPDSVCKLSGLSILDLRECSYLEELPTDIGSLKNLTHLDMTNCRLLTKLPKGIRLLSKLEVLKGLVISSLDSGTKACVLADLLNLKKLRKLSVIVSVNLFPNDIELQVFKEMNNLRKLKISWENDYNFKDRMSCHPAAHEDLKVSKWKKLKCWERQSCENDEEDTSRSKHLDNLEKLELWCFPNETAPHWLDPAELKQLKKLYIVGGSLTKLHGGTNLNKWNVTALRLKYLPKLDIIRWIDLKTMFLNLTYFQKHQCPSLILYPCDHNGVWRNLMEPSTA